MKFRLSILLILILNGVIYAQQDSNRVYMFVPQMPAFKGDVDAYVANHFQFPQSEGSQGAKGTVNVTFVISQTGEVADVKILSGVYPDIDSEAVRVIRTMPAWTPGMKDGKPVRVQYNLPIHIQPNNNSSNQRHENVYRQRDTIKISREGLYLDPNIGAGIGGPPLSSTDIKVSRGLNLKAGVGLTKMLSSNIGFSTGLQVQQYNFSYSIDNTNATTAFDGTVTSYRSAGADTVVTAGYSGSIKYTFLYAQVPILARYISSQENRLGFYAEAGVVLGYLVSSSITGDVTQTQYQLTQAPNTYWYMYSATLPASPTPVSLTAQNPAKVTASFHADIGAIIPFNAKFSLILAATPDIGLMNAGNGSGDVMNFGSTKFYVFGNGNYGNFTTWLFDAKLLIKLSGSSRVIHLY